MDLIEDLGDIANAMWCEYGLDYGITQSWDEIVLEIIEIFNDKYNKNITDLTKLIEIIEKEIKK